MSYDFHVKVEVRHFYYYKTEFLSYLLCNAVYVFEKLLNPNRKKRLVKLTCKKPFVVKSKSARLDKNRLVFQFFPGCVNSQ